VKSLALLISLLLVSATADAEAVTGIVGGSEVLSMVMSLVIIVAAILALAWLFSRSKLAATGGRDSIQIVASRALGTKERLLLVEVGDQQLLVGMTPTQVNTLHVFDGRVVEVEPQTMAGNGFAARLRTTLSENSQ